MLPYEPLPQEREKTIDLMNRPNELVDVPEHLRTEEQPKERTPLIADKNAMARNRPEDRRLPEDLPFSRGEQPDIKSMEDPDDSEQQHDPLGGAVVLSPRTGGMPDFKEAEEIPKWSPDLVLRPEYRGDAKGKEKRLEVDRPGDMVERELVVIPLDDLDDRVDREDPSYKKHKKFGLGIGLGRLNPSYNNKVTVARDFGDFSFSTLAWDYAPYLYELRENVRRHWFPPPAFRMGIVSGRVIVNFKIMPDGQLRDFKVLSYRAERDEAYSSLVRSSEFAIKGATPFKPLPTNFPDPFLEITATFFYRILGQE